MTTHPLYLVLGALAAIAVGVPTWAHYAPRSWWLTIGFPLKATRVYLTWTHVSASCGLAAKRRRWRLTLDAIPIAGGITRASLQLHRRHRLRRVDVPHPPGLGLLHPSTLGWSVRVRLREGQVRAKITVKGRSLRSRLRWRFAPPLEQ